jgi:hypothetical protein
MDAGNGSPFFVMGDLPADLLRLIFGLGNESGCADAIILYRIYLASKITRSKLANLVSSFYGVQLCTKHVPPDAFAEWICDTSTSLNLFVFAWSPGKLHPDYKGDKIIKKERKNVFRPILWIQKHHQNASKLRISIVGCVPTPKVLSLLAPNLVSINERFHVTDSLSTGSVPLPDLNTLELCEMVRRAPVLLSGFKFLSID